MKEIIWFWKRLFVDFKNHNKLWVLIHGMKPFMEFLRIVKERRK